MLIWVIEGGDEGGHSGGGGWPDLPESIGGVSPDVSLGIIEGGDEGGHGGGGGWPDLPESCRRRATGRIALGH